MSMTTVSFRTPSDKLKKLDSLAGTQQRDRTFVLNEAIDQYLSLHEYHTALIEQGLQDVKAGNVVSHGDVGQQLAVRRAARTSRVPRKTRAAR
jgi:predicted transcriptional regulator